MRALSIVPILCLLAAPALAKPVKEAAALKAVEKAGFRSPTVLDRSTDLTIVLAESVEATKRIVLVSPKGVAVDLGDAPGEVTATAAPAFLGDKALWDVTVTSNTTEPHRTFSTARHYIVRTTKKGLLPACQFEGTKASDDDRKDDGGTTDQVTVAKTSKKPLGFSVTTTSSHHHSEPVTAVTNWTFAADGTCVAK